MMCVLSLSPGEVWEEQPYNKVEDAGSEHSPHRVTVNTTFYTDNTEVLNSASHRHK